MEVSVTTSNLHDPRSSSDVNPQSHSSSHSFLTHLRFHDCESKVLLKPIGLHGSPTLDIPLLSHALIRSIAAVCHYEQFSFTLAQQAHSMF
jgi:hypothetical protein